MYQILSSRWEEPALEFFWNKDENASPETVLSDLTAHLEKEEPQAYAAAAALFWMFGNGKEGLATARELMLKAYEKAEGKDKKRYQKEADQIGREMNG